MERPPLRRSVRHRGGSGSGRLPVPRATSVQGQYCPGRCSVKEEIVPEPRPGPIAEHDKPGERPPRTPVRKDEPDPARPGPVIEEPHEKNDRPEDDSKDRR